MNKPLHRLAVPTFALTLLALAGFTLYGQNQDKHADHKEHDIAMQACAKACSDCQRMCDMCGSHCAHMVVDGRKTHAASIASCLDCSTICSAASTIVARGGPFSTTICSACAEACNKCALNCEKFPDDKHMKMCAEECRKCEKACQDMLKHMNR